MHSLLQPVQQPSVVVTIERVEKRKKNRTSLRTSYGSGEYRPAPGDESPTAPGRAFRRPPGHDPMMGRTSDAAFRPYKPNQKINNNHSQLTLYSALHFFARQHDFLTQASQRIGHIVCLSVMLSFPPTCFSSSRVIHPRFVVAVPVCGNLCRPAPAHQEAV